MVVGQSGHGGHDAGIGNAGPLHRGAAMVRGRSMNKFGASAFVQQRTFFRGTPPPPLTTSRRLTVFAPCGYGTCSPSLWAWLSGMPLCHLTAVAMKHVIGRRHSTSTVANVNVKCERSTFLRYLRALRDCVMLNCSLLFDVSPREGGGGCRKLPQPASCRWREARAP